MVSGVIGKTTQHTGYDYTTLNSPPCSAFTSPDIPPVNYPEGFQGNTIPIDGTLVARICHERLSLVDEADD